MQALAADSDDARRIDGALEEWRQGDLALDEPWFMHVGDPSVPLSAAAAQAPDAGIQALTSEVLGLVVVTQTCDVVRSCVARPYIEVAPLVLVSEDQLHAVKRGRRPAYAALPALESSCRVADLDRVMTVEKSIVATWKRTPGLNCDADRRSFAQALARKRLRFAFPDDFTALAKKLNGRLTEKHDKGTAEGRALRALREIRVHATPSWDAPLVSIDFWFVRASDDTEFESENAAGWLKKWLDLVPPLGRFTEINGQVVDLRDMTAEDYVDSDPLDLDQLSAGST